MKTYAVSTSGNIVKVTIKIDGHTTGVRKFNSISAAKKFVESEGLIWN